MYSSLSLAALLVTTSIALTNAAVVPRQQREAANGIQVKSETPKAFSAATLDQITQNYSILERKDSGGSHASAALRIARINGNVSTSAPLENFSTVEYLVPIQFGNQNFKAILDTGSSDTWLISSKFKCTDRNGVAQAQSVCNFGALYKGDFGSNKINGQNFKIGYGDGETVTGDMGYQDVTIAGITVPKQEVALGTAAYWNGDGASAGLLGLAYPGITSAFLGTNPNQDFTHAQYDPLFTHMYKAGLSPPSFSLALQRGSDGGYIAFGGLPPVQVSSDFTATSIQALSVGSGGPGGSAYTFYAMTPNGFKYGSSGSSGSQYQYVIDSGTTLNYLPSNIAAAVNALFNPPAQQSQGLFLVNCNAQAPTFGVTVGGTTFYADARDMILTAQPDPSTGLCVSGVQDGGIGPFILGDVWLKSLVVVFDVGASQLRFAQHNY